jgi:hypothetical protein
MGAPSTERAGVRQAIRALVADGWTLHSVDSEPVCTETEAMTEIEAVGFVAVCPARRRSGSRVLHHAERCAG